MLKYSFKITATPILNQARTGIVMNIIGILCITLAINSWGKAMFHLDSFPAWANITGVWAWFCLKRWSTHTLPSLSTGANQRPLVRVTAQDDTVDRLCMSAAKCKSYKACFHWQLSLMPVTESGDEYDWEWKKWLEGEIIYFLFALYHNDVRLWKRPQYDRNHILIVFISSDKKRRSEKSRNTIQIKSHYERKSKEKLLIRLKLLEA